MYDNMCIYKYGLSVRALQETLEKLVAHLSFSQRCLVPRALDNPELELPLPLQESPLEAYMLLLGIDPVPEWPTLPQPQPLQIPQSVGKWHHTVPVPTVQIYTQACLDDQPGVLVHATRLVPIILVVDGLVAGHELLVVGPECGYVAAEVVLDSLVVLASSVQVVVFGFGGLPAGVAQGCRL